MNTIRSQLGALIVGVFGSRDSTPAGLFSIFQTLVLALAGAVGCEALAQWAPAGAYLFRSLGVFWVGTRMRALGNMMHECSHGIFVRKAGDNTRLGHLLAALDLSSFAEYTRQHVSHHAYLGDAERDLDFRSRHFLINRPRSFRSITTLIIFSVLLLPLWLLMLRPFFWARETPLWSNVLRVVLITILLGLLFVPGMQKFIFVYVCVPYLTAYQWMRIFSDACDHLFLSTESDPLQRSRNHLFRSKILDRLLFPRNDSYHLLHHLFPALPTSRYPEAHELLLNHEWYRNRSHFLFERKCDFSMSAANNKVVQGQSK